MLQQNVKVYGLNHLHENTHIKFTNDGLILSVGLNVEEKISRILRFNQLVTGFTGNVYKGDSMFVYRHYKKISSSFINTQTIEFVQSELIKQVQIDINKAKAIYYQGLAVLIENK